MRKLSFLLLIVFSMGAFACATTGASKITLSGLEDEQETSVTVSSYNYDLNDPTSGFFNMSDYDYYFIGYIDKKTGDRLYQLHMRFVDEGDDIRDVVTYLTREEVVVMSNHPVKYKFKSLSKEESRVIEINSDEAKEFLNNMESIYQLIH